MKGYKRFSQALSLAGLAVLLSACANNSLGEAGPNPQTRHTVNRSTSSGGDLLYAADALGGIYVLSYPEGILQGKLYAPSRVSGTVCSDKNGDVFFPTNEVSGGGEILEYAHGAIGYAQPIQILPNSGGDAFGCSVDPVTGNLAVANINVDGYRGDIVIFQNAQGNPTTYYDSESYGFQWCGYDDAGNLFVQGDVFAELPKGTSTFVNFANSFGHGEPQWDGNHIAIASNHAHSLARISVSGSSVRVVGRTHLTNALGYHSGGSFWIQGNTVITAMVRGGDNIGFYGYPKGGKPTTIVRLGRGARIDGVAVSLPPSR